MTTRLKLFQNKITILKKSFKTNGGLEKQALLILKAFTEKGYEVSILTTQLKGSFPKNIKCYVIKKKIPINCLDAIYWQNACFKWLKKNSSQTILAMDRTTYQTHLRAGNGVHKQYLKNRIKFSNFFKKLSIFFNPTHLISLYLEKKAFHSPHLKKIITNSFMVKSEILKHYNPLAKIEVIHNGVEWENMEKDFQFGLTNSSKIAQKLKIDISKHIFLFIGNDYERKGVKNLIKAANILKENFHLLIIGKEKNIKKYSKYANNSKIIFLKEVKNVIPYYQIANTFVLPTYYDPFANVVLEALSMGLFTITSKQNGASEIITNNGIILESLNIKEIANSLKKAIKFHDKKKIRQSIAHLDIKNQLNKIVLAIHEG